MWTSQGPRACHRSVLLVQGHVRARPNLIVDLIQPTVWNLDDQVENESRWWIFLQAG